MYLELIRDIELVRVKEEEDQVRPFREPPADIGEVVPEGGNEGGREGGREEREERKKDSQSFDLLMGISVRNLPPSLPPSLPTRAPPSACSQPARLACPPR